MRRAQAEGFERGFAKTLAEGKTPRLAHHEFSLPRFRSLTGEGFYGVLAIHRGLRVKQNLTAFLGHRFIPTVTPNVRHNLQLILRPYGIRLVYSDTDMPNGAVFETILRRIARSGFCIFDDRETETRPNVFIELGAAVALRRPYFYFSFQNKRTVRIGGKNERISVPSDLAGMLCLPYLQYEDLFLEFAMRLPGFLVDRGLAKA